MNIVYFDNAATTRIKSEVLNEMMPYLTLNYGNASSLYSIGRISKHAIENARIQVANLINCNPNEIYFTSCGSESDNTALKGFAYANSSKGNHIITSKIEHHAISNSCKTLEEDGVEVTYLNVDKNGKIKLQELENSIKPYTVLISVMTANNEIGTIEPIAEIGKIAKENKILFHTDAVQGIGNIKIDVQKMNIDLLSMSAHKFYGPKGVGALYVREGVLFNPIIDGGHQEKGKRAGTENVPGIVGLGKAIELAYQNIDEYNNQLKELRDYCINQLKKNFNNIKINGDMENRLSGNVNVSFIGQDSSELLLKLDEFGICTSAGSACNTGVTTPSEVLMAIGLKENEASGTLRFSFGKENTKEEIDFLIEKLKEII